MNDLITRIADVDPDFAKTLQRNQWRNYAFAVVAILAIAGAVYAIAVNVDQGKEITQVQHSACQADPAGRECQVSKRESSRAANIATTCIPFFKAGYPCPKPGSTAAQRQARRQQVQANSKSVRNLEQGVLPPSTSSPPGNHTTREPPGHQGVQGQGGSKPPKGGGGGEQSPPSSGDNEPPVQSSPGSAAIPGPSSGAPPVIAQPVEPPPPSSESGPVKSTLEAVGDTVDQTVCSLTEVLKQLC